MFHFGEPMTKHCFFGHTHREGPHKILAKSKNAKYNNTRNRPRIDCKVKFAINHVFFFLIYENY